MMKRIKENYEVILPFAILVVLLAFFGVTTSGAIFTSGNAMMMIKQTLNVIIAGLGMLFVAAMGGTDITQGSLVAVCAAFAATIAVDVNVWLAIPAALVAGLASGLLLGTVNAGFKVPSFMASLAMLIGLRAMVSSIIGGRTVMLPDTLKMLDESMIKFPVVLVLIGIVLYVFNYTRFGAYCRSIGENENAVKFSGVNVTRIKIIAFAISGLMTGVASLFILARVGGSSNVLGIGFEMRIMMAMFIGGVPVSGGSGTKLYKLIVGALTITLLETGLVMTGASGAVTQFVRGFVLLAVVLLTLTMKKRLSPGRS